VSDAVNGASNAEAFVPVGQVISRLRKDRNLTGEQLGRRASMSQAKISKIETGVIAPTAEDATRLARALELSPEETYELVGYAERVFDRMVDARPHSGVLDVQQRDVARIEATTKSFRIFSSGSISGLLQTAEYSRAVFRGLQRERFDAPEAAEAIAKAVSARIDRQVILANSRKRFHFVMPEAVLQYRMCSPVEMVVQIERIRTIARQENVSVGIVPTLTQLAMAPIHSFYLLDRRIVLIDLLNTFVTSRGAADVRVYRRMFDAFEAQAVTDIDPILDEHRARYIASL